MFIQEDPLVLGKRFLDAAHHHFLLTNTDKEFGGQAVIPITKFDGKTIMLNPEHIQTVEATPDTVITLTTGMQLIVRDKVDEIVAAFKNYKKSVSNFSWEVRKQS